MNNFGSIFTDEQYNQLQQGYQKTFAPMSQSFISKLHSVIKSLQHTSFKLPLNLQNQILRNLSNSLQVLNIVYNTPPSRAIKIPNTPLDLIYCLSELSLELTSYTLKSPYQILLLKANSFLLQSINLICQHFIRKA